MGSVRFRKMNFPRERERVGERMSIQSTCFKKKPSRGGKSGRSCHVLPHPSIISPEQELSHNLIVRKKQFKENNIVWNMGSVECIECTQNAAFPKEWLQTMYNATFGIEIKRAVFPKGILNYSVACSPWSKCIILEAKSFELVLHFKQTVAPHFSKEKTYVTLTRNCKCVEKIQSYTWCFTNLCNCVNQHVPFAIWQTTCHTVDGISNFKTYCNLACAMGSANEKWEIISFLLLLEPERYWMVINVSAALQRGSKHIKAPHFMYIYIFHCMYIYIYMYTYTYKKCIYYIAMYICM